MVSLPSLFQNTSNCLIADCLGLGSKGPHLLHGSSLADHRDLRALTKAHVLAPVAHPAAIGVDAHIAPILGLPVAHVAAHARAVVPGVDGINAVVSKPASLVGGARIARDLGIAALLSVSHVGADVLTRVELGSSNGCGAASHALVLAPVAHPAAVQVSAHVAPVLSLPVAVDRANSMAAVPLVHLVNAVVSIPAEVRVISSVTVDLSAVALLSVRFEAGSSTTSTAAVVAARACSGWTCSSCPTSIRCHPDPCRSTPLCPSCRACGKHRGSRPRSSPGQDSSSHTSKCSRCNIPSRTRSEWRCTPGSMAQNRNRSQSQNQPQWFGG